MILCWTISAIKRNIFVDAIWLKEHLFIVNKTRRKQLISSKTRIINTSRNLLFFYRSKVCVTWNSASCTALMSSSFTVRSFCFRFPHVNFSQSFLCTAKFSIILLSPCIFSSWNWINCKVYVLFFFNFMWIFSFLWSCSRSPFIVQFTY